MTTEIVEFGGWKNNLRLSNDSLELIATLDVGPRVLSLAPRSNGTTGENLFCIFEEHAGGSGEGEWMSRGGHRFWIAPESNEDDPFTYFADNAPVAHEILGEGHVKLTPPPETVNGFQKEIEIKLHESEARLTITHRVTNIGSEAVHLAPWAITVMKAGGIRLVPQPPLGSHPEDLLPNRALVLWPYTDLKDPRFHLGTGYVTLRQDAERGPLKFGLAHGGDSGFGDWAAYALNGTLFVKSFAYDESLTYPDKGCNCEMFTNEAMLEVESLNALQTLAPGESAEHVEEWRLFTEIPGFDADSESSIESALEVVLPKLAS